MSEMQPAAAAELQRPPLPMSSHGGSPRSGSTTDTTLRRFVLQVVVDSAGDHRCDLRRDRTSSTPTVPVRRGGVPIATADNGSLVYVLLAGLALTIGNIILRPVIVAVTGRLIWSMGLFSVVVTAIVLAITGFITPLDVHLATPWIVWLLGVAAIVQVVGSVFSALLGLTRPSIDTERTTGGLWGSSTRSPPHAGTRSSRTCGCSRCTTRCSSSGSRSSWTGPAPGHPDELARSTSSAWRTRSPG